MSFQECGRGSLSRARRVAQTACSYRPLDWEHPRSRNPGFGDSKQTTQRLGAPPPQVASREVVVPVLLQSSGRDDPQIIILYVSPRWRCPGGSHVRVGAGRPLPAGPALGDRAWASLSSEVLRCRRSGTGSLGGGLRVPRGLRGPGSFFSSSGWQSLG